MDSESSSRILLIGANGQLGQAWQAGSDAGQIVAALGRESLDLSHTYELTDRLHQLIDSYRPSLIVNAAAYTAVDHAEDHETEAYAINALAPGVMATVAASLSVPFIHYSTDYVFDGQGQDAFIETDPTGPLSVYGRSKLAGERAVQAAGGPHLILRTSWVFGVHGQNFLKTMLRLAQSRDELRVVNDQVGAPTPADLLVQVSKSMLAQLDGVSDSRWGLYHVCPTGFTSWHGYACHTIEQARVLGWPIRVHRDAMIGIASSEYPVKATRPLNSRLCTDKLTSMFSIELPTWQLGVDQVLARLPVPA